MKTHLTCAEIRVIMAMRKKQKEYFTTRSKFILDEAKSLEKQVDRILGNLQLDPVRNTGSLF